MFILVFNSTGIKFILKSRPRNTRVIVENKVTFFMGHRVERTETAMEDDTIKRK